MGRDPLKVEKITDFCTMSFVRTPCKINMTEDQNLANRLDLQGSVREGLIRYQCCLSCHDKNRHLSQLPDHWAYNAVKVLHCPGSPD